MLFTFQFRFIHGKNPRARYKQRSQLQLRRCDVVKIGFGRNGKLLHTQTETAAFSVDPKSIQNGVPQNPKDHGIPWAMFTTLNRSQSPYAATIFGEQLCPLGLLFRFWRILRSGIFFDPRCAVAFLFLHMRDKV